MREGARRWCLEVAGRRIHGTILPRRATSANEGKGSGGILSVLRAEPGTIPEGATLSLTLAEQGEQVRLIQQVQLDNSR